eukprot:TRINITY_DN68312_c0_g1_i1.p1 TRINITY_DN68312_c0_g1~~TRINITY_DN68312_c0_g1_i1.p1  ORF type:complete len:266 (+),score=29.87 TRINITY_DN68312_c0_g1_i1:173-970(+)
MDEALTKALDEEQSVSDAETAMRPLCDIVPGLDQDIQSVEQAMRTQHADNADCNTLEWFAIHMYTRETHNTAPRNCQRTIYAAVSYGLGVSSEKMEETDAVDVTLLYPYIKLLLEGLRSCPLSSPVKGQFFRGQTWPLSTTQHKFQEGQEVTIYTFWSCTTALNQARAFANPGGVLFVLEDVRGGYDIEKVSAHPTEKEVLLPPLMTWRVDSMTQDKTVLTIKMTMIDIGPIRKAMKQWPTHRPYIYSAPPMDPNSDEEMTAFVP